MLIFKVAVLYLIVRKRRDYSRNNATTVRFEIVTNDKASVDNTLPLMCLYAVFTVCVCVCVCVCAVAKQSCGCVSYCTSHMTSLVPAVYF